MKPTNSQQEWRTNLHLKAIECCGTEPTADLKELDNIVESLITQVISDMGTHLPGEETGYCDTGEDMELGCRSECVEMAIKRVTAKYLGGHNDR